MDQVQKKFQTSDSGKKTKKVSGPAREKPKPVKPAKKYRDVKEELPNIGDPLPALGDKLISIKRNAKNKNN